MHKVLQVLPRADYTVYVYFNDGKVKRYDVSHLVGKGVFKPLEDVDWFMNRCTVLNGTLAWDVSGHYDPWECIDLDPEVIYEAGQEVADPLQDTA